MIEICNLSIEKPTYLYDIKICRGVSELGNPFLLKDECDRDFVCDLYEKYFQTQIENNNLFFMDELNCLMRLYKKHGQLRLFCWCAPKRCHAETIRDYILSQINKDI